MVTTWSSQSGRGSSLSGIGGGRDRRSMEFASRGAIAPDPRAVRPSGLDDRRPWTALGCAACRLPLAACRCCRRPRAAHRGHASEWPQPVDARRCVAGRRAPPWLCVGDEWLRVASSLTCGGRYADQNRRHLPGTGSVVDGDKRFPDLTLVSRGEHAKGVNHFQGMFFFRMVEGPSGVKRRPAFVFQSNNLRPVSSQTPGWM